MMAGTRVRVLEMEKRNPWGRVSPLIGRAKRFIDQIWKKHSSEKVRKRRGKERKKLQKKREKIIMRRSSKEVVPSLRMIIGPQHHWSRQAGLPSGNQQPDPSPFANWVALGPPEGFRSPRDWMETKSDLSPDQAPGPPPQLRLHQPNGQPESAQTLFGSTWAGPNLKIPSKGRPKPGWVQAARWTPGPIIILNQAFTQRSVPGWSNDCCQETIAQPCEKTHSEGALVAGITNTTTYT